MRVILREGAQRQFVAAITQCELLFGRRVASHFYEMVEHSISLLAVNPRMGERELLLEDRQIKYRSLLVHKHFKVVYYIDEMEDAVYIVALWDVRREPREQAGDMKENTDNMK